MAWEVPRMRAVAASDHRSCKVKLIPWRAFRPPAAVPPFALFPPALCAPAFLDSDFFDCPGFVVFRLSRVVAHGLGLRPRAPVGLTKNKRYRIRISSLSVHVSVCT